MGRRFITGTGFAVVEDVEEEEHITRKSTRILPFQCSYEKKAVISKVFYSPDHIQVITETGVYKLVLSGHIFFTGKKLAIWQLFHWRVWGMRW